MLNALQLKAIFCGSLLVIKNYVIYFLAINHGEGGFQSGTNRAVMDWNDP